MRFESFAQGECYYLSGRGAGGREIFEDEEDKARFIFLLTHLQSPVRIYNIGWYTARFLKKKSLPTTPSMAKGILRKRSVELLSFAITPSSFHLLVKNLEDGSASVYMQRALTAYSKYWNAKHKSKGHVFDGPFRAVKAKNHDQLIRFSAYIHKVAQNVKGCEGGCESYPYSSYQDYLEPNRWGKFLSPNAVLKQFKSPKEYRAYVESSVFKEAI